MCHECKITLKVLLKRVFIIINKVVLIVAQELYKDIHLYLFIFVYVCLTQPPSAAYAFASLWDHFGDLLNDQCNDQCKHVLVYCPLDPY